MPKNCEQSRVTLLAEQANQKANESEEFFGFLMAFEGLVELEPGQLSPEIDDALNHLYNCDDCQAWHKTLFPEHHATQARIAKYCCIHMYCAINEDTKNKFTLAWFRDEPCWCMNDDWSFAHFCPWCGKTLPMEGFEPSNFGWPQGFLEQNEEDN